MPLPFFWTDTDHMSFCYLLLNDGKTYCLSAYWKEEEQGYRASVHFYEDDVSMLSKIYDDRMVAKLEAEEYFQEVLKTGNKNIQGWSTLEALFNS